MQNKFQRCRAWPLSWISDRNDFSYFLFTRNPDASYQTRVNWPLGSEKEAKIEF